MRLDVALTGYGSPVGISYRRFFLIGVAALLPLGVAGAQDTPTAEPEVTLEDLQRRVAELEKRNEKMPSTGSSDVSVKVFGRIHLDFWDFANSDESINVLENGDPDSDPLNTWEFRRVRMGLSGKVYDNMKYKASIDFGKPDGLTYKDVYIGFTKVPGLQELRIGNRCARTASTT